MACFHPLKGYIVGVNPITGKNKLLIRPYIEENPPKLEFVEIPCGKCIGCRLEYSRQWANRMMLELEYHDSAYFVTLTYSDDFVPKRPVYDPETGEYKYDSLSLRKSDLSKFLKHVRKHFPDDKIRFFGVGEYGGKTCRPHYHLILYGLHLDDLTVYKRNRQGDVLYNSRSLENCWSNFVGVRSDGSDYYDKVGHVVIAPVNWETCAYVARYVTKKMSGPLEDWFISQNMENPFSLMSRRDGIGKQWYLDHPELFDYEYINLKTKEKGLKFRPPKYFEKLYEIDFPDEAMQRKEIRTEFLKTKREALLAELDNPYLDYLADKENNLKSRLKALDRTVV